MEVVNVSPFSSHIAQLGESPTWLASEHALYWIDVIGRTVHQKMTGSSDETQWPLPGLPASIVLRRGGGFLMAFRNRITFADGAAGPYRDVDLRGIDFAAERINDSAVDSRGRFWFGTFAPKFTSGGGSLYRLDPDLTLHRIDRGFSMSNGIAWSPDASTMYFVDTYEYCIWRYRFDEDTGTVSGRERFIEYPERVARPDGCCVDADGLLWVAEVDAWRIAGYAPDSTSRHAPVRTISLPLSKPTSVAFGGPDLRTLFITTEWRGLDALERQQQPLAGATFIAEGVSRGLPQHAFSG